jgi:hypothetical protein
MRFLTLCILFVPMTMHAEEPAAEYANQIAVGRLFMEGVDAMGAKAGTDKAEALQALANQAAKLYQNKRWKFLSEVDELQILNTETSFTIEKELIYPKSKLDWMAGQANLKLSMPKAEAEKFMAGDSIYITGEPILPDANKGKPEQTLRQAILPITLIYKNEKLSVVLINVKIELAD